MSITKKYLKTKPEVKITFNLHKSAVQNAKSVVLLSEHNNWQAVAFKNLKNGNFKVAINIPLAERDGFQFTYQATADDGAQFTLLPDDADNYVDNGMNNGDKNAVIVIND